MIRAGHLQWYWVEGGDEDRWAIVISTKISKRSTVRNRLRRIIREQLRAWSGATQGVRKPFQVVIVVRKLPAQEESILQECRQCLQRLHPFQFSVRGGFALRQVSSGGTNTPSRGTTNGATGSAV